MTQIAPGPLRPSPTLTPEQLVQRIVFATNRTQLLIPAPLESVQLQEEGTIIALVPQQPPESLIVDVGSNSNRNLHGSLTVGQLNYIEEHKIQLSRICSIKHAPKWYYNVGEQRRFASDLGLRKKNESVKEAYAFSLRQLMADYYQYKKDNKLPIPAGMDPDPDKVQPCEGTIKL